MKKLYFLFLTFFLAIGVLHLKAQVRYLDEITQSVDVAVNEIYAENISILTGAPTLIPLVMDVYTPSGDTETDRPVMIVPHTGNFLPQYLNGSVTGGKNDSIVVNICKSFAKRGYVAVAMTYRLGWLPLATNQDVRTGTLLQAVYRAVQDTRTCIRYFKYTANEEGNPWGVDPNKIGVFGVGSGGYLSLAAATLDDYEEVVIDKFLDSLNLPYADTLLLGNFYGTTDAPLCDANFGNYDSDFQLCVNLGGALGDSTWLDGKQIKPNEPAFVGFHSSRDFFAPFYMGAVIVPTTGEFVVDVVGTRYILEKANEYGNNDILNLITDEFDYYKTFHDKYSNTAVITYQQQVVTGAVPHFYPTLFEEFLPPNGDPWNWWDKPTLDATIAYLQATFPGVFDDVSSDTLHLDGLKTNPNMSREQGLAYLDTIINYTVPRACLALELSCKSVVGVTDLNPLEVDLSIAPNPGESSIQISTKVDYPIQSVYVYDLNGRLVKAKTGINCNHYQLDRGVLVDGVYIAQMRFKEGVVSKKIIFN